MGIYNKAAHHNVAKLKWLNIYLVAISLSSAVPYYMSS